MTSIYPIQHSVHAAGQSITPHPEFAPPFTVKIAQPAVEQCYTILQPEWQLNADWLSKRTESLKASGPVRACHQQQQLAQPTYWPTTNGRAFGNYPSYWLRLHSQTVSELQRKASEKLLSQFGLSLNGYQSLSRDAVML